MSKRSTVIAIGSRNFFGAERRFMKLVRQILRRDDLPIHVYLIINYSLYVAAKKVAWAGELLAELEESRQLVVLPDGWTSAFKGRNIVSAWQLLRSDRLRAILHGRIFAIPRLLISRDTIFEVTSVDDAAKIVGAIPSFLLRKVRSFNCVSDTVAARLTALLKDRGYTPLLDRIRIDHAPLFVPTVEDYARADKGRTITFASRFISRKNPILFAKAVDAFLTNHPEWNVNICGRGELEQDIKAILKEHIGTRVDVRYDSRLEETLRSSSVYVSLIEPNNYPSQSILEAMYYGCALLLSNTGNSADFISRDAPNGVLVELSVESVVAGLERLCASASELSTMGMNSRRLLDRSFSYDEYISSFVSHTLQHRHVR